MGGVLGLEGERLQLDLLLGLEEIIQVEMVWTPVQVKEEGSMVKAVLVAVVENWLQLQMALMWIELQ